MAIEYFGAVTSTAGALDSTNYHSEDADGFNANLYVGNALSSQGSRVVWTCPGTGAKDVLELAFHESLGDGAGYGVKIAVYTVDGATLKAWGTVTSGNGTGTWISTSSITQSSTLSGGTEYVIVACPSNDAVGWLGRSAANSATQVALAYASFPGASISQTNYAIVPALRCGVDTAAGGPPAADTPNIFDATTLTENISLIFTPMRPSTIVQGVTITEAVSLLRTPLVPNVNDAVTLSEDLSLPVSTVVPLTISVWDLVIHHEEGEYPTIRFTPQFVNLYDAVTLTGTVALDASILDAITKSTAQVITVTDAPTVVLPILKLTVFDATTVTSAPTLDIRGTTYPNVFDAVTVTEALDKGCPWVFPGYIGPGDGFTLTESVTIGLRSYVDKYDGITVSEAVAFLVSPALAHTLTVFDGVSVSDEDAELFGNFVPEVADAVTVTDEPTLSVLAVGTLLPEVSDDVTLTESAEAVLVALVPTGTDAVTLTEDVALELIRRIDIDVAESVTTTETLAALLTTLRPIVDDAVTVGSLVDFTFNSSRQISVLEAIAVTESADFGRSGSIIRRRRRL